MANAWRETGRFGREAVHRLREAGAGLGNVAARAERSAPRRPQPASEPVFPALHWMTAALFVAAGAEAALRAQAARAPGGLGPRNARATLAALAGTLRDPAVFAPLLAAPLAGAAHAARALRRTSGARLAARVLDGVAAGVAVAGAARVAYNALARRPGPEARPGPRLAGAVAPLTFGATALLGLILEHEEDRERRELERLRHRASVVERLVPRRKPRLDHIVLHI